MAPESAGSRTVLLACPAEQGTLAGRPFTCGVTENLHDVACATPDAVRTILPPPWPRLALEERNAATDGRDERVTAAAAGAADSTVTATAIPAPKTACHQPRSATTRVPPFTDQAARPYASRLAILGPT